MLDRNIDVIAYLRFACDGIDEFVSNTIIVNVHQSDPFYTFNSTKSVKKLRQTDLSVQISAVLGRVLSNQNEFFYSCSGHIFRFFYAILDPL